MLTLTLGVNDAIESSVFLSSINASINAIVMADVRCDYVLSNHEHDPKIRLQKYPNIEKYYKER